MNFESRQVRNRRQAYLLVVILFAVLAGVIGGGLWYVGAAGPVVVALAAAVAAGSSLLAWWQSDRIVLTVTRARIVTREERPQLHNLVEEICIAAGLPVPRIALVDDPAPNAFATGRSPERAVVAFTTGIVDLMERDELQGVVAHELAHIANRDTLVMTIAATTAGSIALASDLLLRAALIGGGRRRSNSRSGGAALLLVFVGLVLAPVAAVLLKSALSRSREQLADVTAVEFTRNPAGLRRALQKLAADSTVVQRRSAAIAHLWIECPIDTGQRLNRLYATHPPIADRVAALWQLEGNTGQPPPLPGSVDR